MSISYCDLCYEYVATPCTSFTFPIGLNAVTEYTMVLVDGHGNIFTQTGYPDPSVPESTWTIDPSTYPDGMFNEFSGSYEVHFHEGGEYDSAAAPSTLTISGKEYQCVLITFKNVTVIA